MNSTPTNRETTPPTPNAGEWIEWTGGENPVGDAMVEVKCRDGSTDVEVGSSWNWDSEYAPIIAYRIVTAAQDDPVPPEWTGAGNIFGLPRWFRSAYQGVSRPTGGE